MQTHHLQTSTTNNHQNPFISLKPAFDFNEVVQKGDFGLMAEAVEFWIERLNECIQTLLKEPEPTWQGLMPLLALKEKLVQVINLAHHFYAVCYSEDLKPIYEKVCVLTDGFESRFYQDQALAQYHQLLHSNPNLSPQQKRHCQLELQRFKAQGVHLQKEVQQQVLKANQRLGQLAILFESNLQNHQKDLTYHTTDKSQLDGLAPYLKKQAKGEAQKLNKKGYCLHLDEPTTLAVLKTAQCEKLRLWFHQNYSSRCGRQSAFSNQSVIIESLKLRQQKAQLLGFNDFSESQLIERMAQTPKKVEDFLYALLEKLKPLAKSEKQDLEQFAKNQLGLGGLEAHNLSWVKEQYQAFYDGFSFEHLRQYFPFHKVRQGLFSLISSLFSVQFEPIKPAQRPVWAKDVEVFALKKNTQTIGFLYWDMFARTSKRAGAWMSEYQHLSHLNSSKQRTKQQPIAFIHGNFPNQEEVFLNFDEVLTLFHEMGHALHHLLTEVDLWTISGINQVEWDAVELPSQWLENFAWQKSTLQAITQDPQNPQNSMDEELMDKLQSLRGRYAGLHLSRQIFLSLLDLKLHQLKNPTEKAIEHTFKSLQKECLSMPLADYDEMLCSFSHIFAGEYACGYYSYLWAEVLSHQAFFPFKKALKLTNSQQVMDSIQGEGLYFLERFLSQGATQSAKDLFKNLSGKVDENHLLECYGVST